MTSTVTKSVTIDFGGNFVLWIFDEEAATDGTISGKYLYTNQDSDTVSIVFSAGLNGPETVALDAVIATHDPVATDLIPDGTQEVPTLIIADSSNVGEPDLGTGRLYKKTGDDGIYWNVNGGTEIDLTDTNIIVQDEGSDITNTPHTTLNFVGASVTASDGGSGVATLTINDNTASNVGSGAGWFKQKTGLDLEFKTIIAGSTKLGITNNTNDLTLDVNESNINHDNLLGFVGNEHIDHSSILINAGVGLSGGGDITASRTIDLDINSLTTDATPDPTTDFIASYDTSAAGHKKILLSNMQRIQIQDEGIAVTNTPHTTLNFVGGGVTVTDAGSGVSTITVPDPASTVTLQNAYDNTVGGTPELILDTTRGALTIRDNAIPLSASLFEVQNFAGSTTYLASDTTGIQVNGGVTIDEKVTNPMTPAAGKGTLWVRNDASQKIMFSDDVGSDFVLNPLTTKGDIYTHNSTEEVRHTVGSDGYFLIADSSTSTGLNWAIGGQTIGDIQGVSITDLSGVDETSTTFVDLPDMTLTTNNSGTADYLVIFSGFMRTSNAGGSRRIRTIVNIGGTIQSSTERRVRPANSADQLWSTQHFVTNVANGTVIKVQWRRSGSNMTMTMYNRELIIVGLN